MANREEVNDVISDFPFQEESEDTEEIYVCEVCKQEFDTQRGRNIHRGQAHRSE